MNRGEYQRMGNNEWQGKDGTIYEWKKSGSNYILAPKDKFVVLPGPAP
jgi:hypothetical protein